MNTPIRTQILQQAERLINGDRQAHYGPPSENFNAIAAMWTTYTGHHITAADVCHMMALLKIARLRNGAHTDSSVDGAGYLALGAEMYDDRVAYDPTPTALKDATPQSMYVNQGWGR